MRNAPVESRLVLAGHMLETQQKKNAGLRKQVSAECVGAV